MYASVAYLYFNKPVIEIVAAQPTPIEYLYAKCQAPDCNPELLDAIATCESQWRMIQNSASSAYGYFQILDSTERTTPQWKAGKRKYDPYTSVDMGIYLFETRGSNPWNESKPCWHWRYQYKLAELEAIEAAAAAEAELEAVEDEEVETEE